MNHLNTAISLGVKAVHQSKSCFSLVLKDFYFLNTAELVEKPPTQTNP
jgi:hypothetical protein